MLPLKFWNDTAMQLHPSECNPPRDAEIVCRQSWLVALAAVFVYSGLLGGVPATLWYTGKLPNWLAAGIAAIAAIVFPMVGHSFFATLRRSNWTFAMAPDGLWLNLRSYRNYRLGKAKTVVHLSYRELASAAKHIAHRSTQTGDGTTTWTELSLDLWLLSPDAGRLKKAIAEERARTTKRKLLGGLVTTSGRANHVPVTVPQDGIVRVIWKSRYDFVRPKLNEVLERIAKHVNVLENQVQNTNDDWLELPDEQLDSRILQLVEAGDSLSAVKLLRLRRGYTITEAKQFVDELTGHLAKPSKPVPSADSRLSE